MGFSFRATSVKRAEKSPNECLWDFLLGQPMSKELKKVLTNAERLLELEEERNRLVDKVCAI